MPKTILTGGQSGTLRRGLRDSFANAYETTSQETREELAAVMPELPSDTDQEFYAYFKSAPYPRHWPRGSEVEKSGFEAVQFSVVNYDKGIEVEWHKNDELNSKVPLRSRAAEAGENFSYLDTEAFFDLLLGTTVVLPGTVTAPDGAAIFATTAGGAARFGATNGNLLTGTGGNSFSSVTVLRGDIWAAVEQFHLFQNTEGRPLWAKQRLKNFIVFFAADEQEVANEAFNLNPAPMTFGTAGTDLSSTSVSNPFMSAGLTFELRPTPHITDNDIFVVMKDAPQKPFFKQVHTPVEELPFDENNSKDSARSLLRSLIFHEYSGYGSFLPYQIIKINNS